MTGHVFLASLFLTGLLISRGLAQSNETETVAETGTEISPGAEAGSGAGEETPERGVSTMERAMDTAKILLHSLSSETVIKSVKDIINNSDTNYSDIESIKDAFVRSANPVIIDGFKRTNSKGIGEKCSADSECSSSTCLNGECKCNSDRVYSPETATCLSMAKSLGDECTVMEQCTAGLDKTVGKTICLNFKCSCHLKHKLQNGSCVEQYSLGTVCIADENCSHASGSVCTQEVCTCPLGKVPSPEEDKCIPVAKSTLDECKEDIQCSLILHNSVCKNSKCVCKPLNTVVAGICVPIKALSDSCNDDAECVKLDEEASTDGAVKRGCVNNQCACVKGKREDDVCISGVRGASIDTYSTTLALVLALIMSKLIVN